MIGLLLLFGFAPADGPLPADPPARRATSPRLSQLVARPAWDRFAATWGGIARWDGETPRFVALPGVPLEQAEALIADLAALARVPAEQLSLTTHHQREDRDLLVWSREVQGAPVEGEFVLVYAVAGRIAGVRMNLAPLPTLPHPQPGERIIRLPTRGEAALVRRFDAEDRISYVDRNGAEVYAYDPRRYADVWVEYEPRTAGDALVTAGARSVTVTDSSGASAVTDSSGAHGLSGDLSISFSSDFLTVQDANNGVLTASGTDDITLSPGDTLSYSGLDVLYHTHVVFDWLANRWPSHTWVNGPVTATVRIAASCNAYYTNQTINFYAEGNGCVDTGRLADVIYHEVGHGIHQYVLATGTFASDISEGSSDYVAATILDDPTIGYGFYGDGTYLRELDTDKIYPTNSNGESHNDGLIWASFLWNLREQWITTYGSTDGVERTDLLFLGALEQGPALTDAYEAVLLADDDDGDLSNSTPHACELKDLLDYHGLGPGPIGVLSFSHTPPGPQDSSTTSYPISFDLYDLTSGCSGLDTSSVTLRYTTDDAAALDDTSAWTELPITQVGSTWTGEIPRQPATSHVRYYIAATSTDGTQTVTTYGDNPEAVYSFYVGDREDLWCDDFEAGGADWSHSARLPSGRSRSSWVDQWAVGAPAGGTWDPGSAWSGSNILGINLEGDYSPNNGQSATSPTIDVSGHGPMLLLSYRRYLTVEDALYDQAVVWLSSQPIWSNEMTIAGSSHNLDMDWTLHEFAIDELLSEDSFTVSFSLESDEGLEYGGWQVDDVCVQQLADVAGHFRVDDLVASDGDPAVQVSWSWPWIKPMTAGRLVRKAGSLPTGPEDGEVLMDFAAPVAGEEVAYLDAGRVAGTTWYYAVFVADDNGFYPDVVSGENADDSTITLDALTSTDDGLPAMWATDTASSDTASPDTADAPEEDTAPDGSGDTSSVDESAQSDKADPPAGCGCATGRGSPAGLLGLLALLWRRIRK